MLSCRANQQAGFYMMETLVVKGLKLRSLFFLMSIFQSITGLNGLKNNKLKRNNDKTITTNRCQTSTTERFAKNFNKCFLKQLTMFTKSSIMDADRSKRRLLILQSNKSTDIFQ